MYNKTIRYTVTAECFGAWSSYDFGTKEAAEKWAAKLKDLGNNVYVDENITEWR